MDENPEAKEAGLAHLCEFIEDCEHTVITLSHSLSHTLSLSLSRSLARARANALFKKLESALAKRGFDARLL